MIPDTCDPTQAVLVAHPDWCVGEKRVKRLNRFLNESSENEDVQQSMCVQLNGTTLSFDDDEWENADQANEFFEEREWVIVDPLADL